MSLRKIAALLCFLSIHKPALAYVDPGTGIMLFQAAIAAIGAFLAAVRNPVLFFRAFLHRIRRLLSFRGLRKK